MNTYSQLNQSRHYIAVIAALYAHLSVGCSADLDDSSPTSTSAADSYESADRDDHVAGPTPMNGELGQVQSALLDAQCGHSICSEGSALPFGCDPCVNDICLNDFICCTSTWDAACVAAIAAFCPDKTTESIPPDAFITTAHLIITTGGDDLRGGSQAFGTFQLSNGGTLPLTSLNDGAGYANNSVHSASISFSPPRRRADLAAFVLEWDGAPRRFPDGYDNWNADLIEISFDTTTTCRTPNTQFAPGRMTGERTFASTPLGR
jgi:hypothetical protein